MDLKYVPISLTILFFISLNSAQAAESSQFLTEMSVAEKKIDKFSASDTTVREPAVLEVYNKLFQLSYEFAPEVKIARSTKEQKSKEVYTATAKRYAPALDARLSQVHELNYEGSDTSLEIADETYMDDRDYTDWGMGLDLPIYRKPLSVSLHIAKAEETLAENSLIVTTQELDLKLQELLGNYLESTYRLFNIRNSVKLSKEHVAKIYRGYELRDQTKLQLLRAQANLKDLETRLDLDEQDQEIALRALLDFSGLDEGNPIFNELDELLQDEMRIAGCINTLAAIEEHYLTIESYIEGEKSQELFTFFKDNSLLYKNIVLEKILAENKAQTFTQDEWFDISVKGNYDRREDTRFSDYDGEGTLSLVLSVPLFTGGTIFSTKETKASAIQIATTQELADLRAQFHTLENIKKSIISLKRILLKQQVNLQQQKEIVVLSLKSYQIKQTSMQDLLTSQNKLIDVKNGLMQTTNRLGSLFRQFAWVLGKPFPAPQVE